MRWPALGIGLALVGCSSSDAATTTVSEAKSALVRNTAPSVPDADKTTLANDNQAFALNAYAALAKSSAGSNVFFSPYSISSALAMTYAGANGQTATEIATALHFSLPQAQLHPAFDQIDLALTSTPVPTPSPSPDSPTQTPFTLHVANSLWGATNETFKQPFLDTLAVNYGGGVYLDDFGKPSPETPINQWVSDQTNAKITDLIKPGQLDAATRFVLVNAIYFDADWRAPFDATSTANQNFTTDAGPVSVPMMHGGDELDVPAVHTDAYDAIELPYKGTSVMDIVLPTAGTFATFEPTLTSDALAKIVASFVPNTWVQLTLPKFSYQGDSISLAPVLQGLGMQQAFTSGADFSNMVADEVFIKDVVQKAYLTVDEKGTEAAAATGVIGEADFAPAGRPTVITIDHPFFFTIRETTTNTILFAGRILDPTK